MTHPILKVLFFVFLLNSQLGKSQVNPPVIADSGTVPLNQQRDVLFYAHKFFPRLHLWQQAEAFMLTGRIFAWMLPSESYEPQTRITLSLGGSLSYRSAGASVYPILVYTQHKQLIFHTTANGWLPGNRHSLTNDWRVLHYTQLTSGFSSFTTTKNTLLLSYNYIRLYEVFGRMVDPYTYLGGGYNLDYHWAIQSQKVTGDSIPLGYYEPFTTSRSGSLGLTINFLYGNRSNQLNPAPSFFTNVLLRTNARLLPAGGREFRIKLNKLSGVNIAVDYGVGAGDSQSVYFTIDELF